MAVLPRVGKMKRMCCDWLPERVWSFLACAEYPALALQENISHGHVTNPRSRPPFLFVCLLFFVAVVVATFLLTSTLS